MKFNFKNLVVITFILVGFFFWNSAQSASIKPLKNRPPMPWFNLNAMTHDDLRAIYQFVRYLGPSGKPAPEYVPAGQEPAGPHAIFPPPPK
jgi:hypothetical protein